MELKSSQGDLATKTDINSLKIELNSDIQRLEDKINNLRWTLTVVAGIVLTLKNSCPKFG